VEDGGHVERRQADVEEYQDRPHRVENHEVYPRGRVTAEAEVAVE
jgi:hypothetical protein